MPTELSQLWFWVLGIAIVVMGFFLRRTVEQLDKISERAAEFVTRTELHSLRADVFAAVEGVRNNEIRQLHEMMRADSKALREELRADVAQVRNEVSRLADALDRRRGARDDT